MRPTLPRPLAAPCDPKTIASPRATANTACSCPSRRETARAATCTGAATSVATIFQKEPARHDFAWCGADRHAVPARSRCGAGLQDRASEPRVAVCTIGDGGSSKADFNTAPSMLPGHMNAAAGRGDRQQPVGHLGAAQARRPGQRPSPRKALPRASNLDAGRRQRPHRHAHRDGPRPGSAPRQRPWRHACIEVGHLSPRPTTPPPMTRVVIDRRAGGQGCLDAKEPMVRLHARLT